jgi:hydroxymethylglutaryl-CoA reductase (NADPH)
LPNLIMGSVGNGKSIPNIEDTLDKLGCLNHDVQPGENARRLAILCAAVVLCGELSLMAAQTNPKELMRSHLLMERQENK